MSVSVDSTFNGILVDNTTYTMTEDITLTTEFTLAAGNSEIGIVWDGAGFTITANKAGWLGLFPFPVTVSNLGILSSNTTADTAGWFFQPNVGGTATNCYSTGAIGGDGGGIFGTNSTGTAIHCYSTGTIGRLGGGIFGVGSGGTATNCYSTGAIVGDQAGGIFGYSSGGSAINCYSTGNIGRYGGGIFASSVLAESRSGSATNCYSTGTIAEGAGGIFGIYTRGTATNCYTTGSTTGYQAGVILGAGSVVTVTSSGHSDGWSDASANTFLTGTPSEAGPGTIWISTSSDTPYTLVSATTTTTTTTAPPTTAPPTTAPPTTAPPVNVSQVTQAVIGPGYRLSGAKITLAENITVSDASFFSGLSDSTIFDGSGNTITVTNPDWPGLFSTAVTVKNLTIDSSGGALVDSAGWFFASGIGGIAYACTNNANVSGNNTGGIFGTTSNGLALSCTNSGDVMTNGNGGIFGAMSTGKAVGCLNTGDIGSACGGIFGIGSIGTAINCGNTGYIHTADANGNGTSAGGIFGYGRYNQDVTATAINCYNSSDSPAGAGGIFGDYYYSNASAINCYSTNGYIHGGGSSVIKTNCYASASWDNTAANAALAGTDGSVWNTATSPYTLAPFGSDYECLKALYPPGSPPTVFAMAKDLGIPEKAIALAIAVNARDDTTLYSILNTVVRGATIFYSAAEAASLYALMTGIDTTVGLTLIIPVSAGGGNNGGDGYGEGDGGGLVPQ